MLLCGLPVPAGLREKLGAWLSTMTEETKVDVLVGAREMDGMVTDICSDSERGKSGRLDM